MPRPKAQKVPDAWDDDDWETQADRAAQEPPSEEESPAPLSKNERIALHKEHNRKLWESADSPEPFHFLEASNPAPAATTNFKPQVKLLARKPAPPRDPAANLAGLSLKDEEEDEEAAVRRHQVEAEARMREGQRLLGEKQRAYEEARRRIFGEEKEDEGRQAGRGSGRGRGRGARGRGRGRGNDARGSDTSRSATSSRSGTPSGATREQHRPTSSPKPSLLQKQDGTQGRRGPARDDGQAPAIREPRGPDGSGRGGFGFARRGAD